MLTFAKSIVVGIVLSCLALVLLHGIGIVLVLRKQQPGIGWDPVKALSMPGFIIYLIIPFLLGFLLTYKHIGKR